MRLLRSKSSILYSRYISSGKFSSLLSPIASVVAIGNTIILQNFYLMKNLDCIGELDVTIMMNNTCYTV